VRIEPLFQLGAWHREQAIGPFWNAAYSFDARLGHDACIRIEDLYALLHLLDNWLYALGQ
jgi:hypothetical protein